MLVKLTPGQRQGDDVGDQRDPDRIHEDKLQQLDVTYWHIRRWHPEKEKKIAIECYYYTLPFYKTVIRTFVALDQK